MTAFDPSIDLPSYRPQFDALQERCYQETRDAGWDPENINTITEELMHIVSELSEAFEEVRLRPGQFPIYYEPDGKPKGVPIEFADILIGLLYNAERSGFSLANALNIKMKWNRDRHYDQEGRQLHPSRTVKNMLPRPGDPRLCALTGHSAPGTCPNCGAARA